MMDFLREWLIRIMGAAVLMSAVSVLTPRGAVKRIALLCCAVLLLLSVLQPLRGENVPNLSGFTGIDERLSRQEEEFLESNRQEWETLIEKELVSYIEAKAQELQFPCSVEIILGTDEEGIPFPEEVKLTAKERNQTLQDCICEEFGVPEERIQWRME